jgi:hypothetical protein
VLVVAVLRPVARRRQIENPSAYVTVGCNVCGLAIALYACKCY